MFRLRVLMRVVHVVLPQAEGSLDKSGHSVHGLLIKMLVLIFGMPTVGTILLYILKKGNDNSLSAIGEAADCKGATS